MRVQTNKTILFYINDVVEVFQLEISSKLNEIRTQRIITKAKYPPGHLLDERDEELSIYQRLTKLDEITLTKVLMGALSYYHEERMCRSLKVDISEWAPIQTNDLYKVFGDSSIPITSYYDEIINLSSTVRLLATFDAHTRNPYEVIAIEIKEDDGSIFIRQLGDLRILQWEMEHLTDGVYDNV